MDYRRILQLLRRHLLRVLVCIVLGVAVSVLLTRAAVKEYSSTSQIFVSASDRTADAANPLSSNSSVAGRMLSYVALTTSQEVFRLVRADLGLPEGAPVAQSVEAAIEPATFLINVTVTDPDADLAADVANSIARNLGTIINRLEALGSGTTLPSVTTAVTREAVASGSPVSPVPSRNYALGFGFGLLLGLLVSALREVTDTRFRSVTDAREGVTAPVLGIIPFDVSMATQRRVVSQSPQSLSAERIRQVRASLRFSDLDNPPQVVAVTSSVPAEGKTSVAVNLAVALGSEGSRVLYVDVDLRRPRGALAFEVSDQPGLTEVLVEPDLLGATLHRVDGIDVLASGGLVPNPSELLATERMQMLIQRARQDYDFIILDCPPVLPVADALTLIQSSDGALFVLGLDRVAREAAVQALTMIDDVGGRVLGVVLNRVRSKLAGAGYGYGYGRGQGYGQAYGDEAASTGRAGRRARRIARARAKEDARKTGGSKAEERTRTRAARSGRDNRSTDARGRSGRRDRRGVAGADDEVRSDETGGSAAAEAVDEARTP
ncbi:polysaccharide biosynthesis tyrosine autokinase [Nocardioides sp.]|uniref:polysaccharide biosynthesis tyrosine autokinase n=1 Tax=Nocardioides sp. TaxID=35761 RepID=UPI003511BFA5